MNPETAARHALNAALPPDVSSSVSLRDGRLTVILQLHGSAPTFTEKDALAVLANAVPGIQADIIVTGAGKAGGGCGSRGEPAVAKESVMTLNAGNIILICSGKGGAGKSSVAAALAIRLAKSGVKTGFADADIHGPSAPVLFGLSGRPDAEDDMLLPKISKEGVKVMSVGFLAPADKALAWRGPMASKTLSQLLSQTRWDTDVLIIDMPPGTGDVQLSLASKLTDATSVVVTQPHPLSLADAARAAAFCKDARVSVAGVLGNMTYLDTPAGRLYPFGREDSVQDFSHTQSLSYLGSLPLLADAKRAHEKLADMLPDAFVAVAMNKRP